MKTNYSIQTILALVFVLAGVSTNSFATLASEDFDLYGYSDDTSLNGADGGTGWPTNSSWVATGTPPCYDGGINLIYFLNGYLNGGPGDAFTGSAFNNGSTAIAGNDYVQRPFAASDFTADTTVWVSALTAFSSTGASTAAFLMFDDGNARLGFQGGKMVVSNGSGNIVAQSSTTFAAGQTHLIVFRIDLKTSGNDTILEWVDPSSVSSQSAMGTPAVSYTADLLGSTLTKNVRIALRGTTSADYVSIDKIRISYGSGASLSEVMSQP